MLNQRHLIPSLPQPTLNSSDISYLCHMCRTMIRTSPRCAATTFYTSIISASCSGQGRQPVPHGNSSFKQSLSLCMNLHTCFPASGCVTACALSSPGNSASSSSSASGANQVRSCKVIGTEVSIPNSSQISGPFLIPVTRGMISLLSPPGPSVTSFCFDKCCLLHCFLKKCSRVCITKQKARRKRSRATWTLVFLTFPSKCPFLSSLLKELSSKAMKRLST